MLSPRQQLQGIYDWVTQKAISEGKYHKIYLMALISIFTMVVTMFLVVFSVVLAFNLANSIL